MATYQVDVGHLVIADVSVVSGERRSEAELHDSATKGTRQLLIEVMKQPMLKRKGKANEAVGEVVQLPAPVMRIPREKAPPKPKALTPWEKFALKKGIALNRKRDSKMWDEAKQEWIDRYGKRRRESERETDWLREVKDDYVAAEEGGDPFLDERRKKKTRLDKQKSNELKNKKRASYEKAELSHLDSVSRNLATASLGKFDKKAKKK